MIGDIMAKKIKTTYDKYVETLSADRRIDFETKFHDLLTRESDLDKQKGINNPVYDELLDMHTELIDELYDQLARKW